MIIFESETYKDFLSPFSSPLKLLLLGLLRLAEGKVGTLCEGTGTLPRLVLLEGVICCFVEDVPSTSRGGGTEGRLDASLPTRSFSYLSY